MIAISAGKFFAGWTPVALAVAAIDPAPRLADLFAVSVAGVTVPPVTCVLGAIGVLAARPLARKGERELSLSLFLIVSILMLIVVQLWVIEYRPGALFAFVIAMGLGFSGYSLIELVGQEIRSVVSKRIKAVIAAIGDQSNEDSKDG